MGAVIGFLVGAAAGAIIVAGAVTAGGGNEPPKDVYAFGDNAAIVETVETPSSNAGE